MSRSHFANAISGQVFGKVDWVTADGKEVGMFIKSSDRESNRVVLRGEQVERMVSNHLLQKNMMVVASGLFSARAFERRADKAEVGELLVQTQDVKAEPIRENRIRHPIYANLKGAIMHWDAGMQQVKVFFNWDEPNAKRTMTCAVYLKKWIAGMEPAKRESFLQEMRAGREFVAAALTEVSCYRRGSDGELVPSLQMFPVHFQFQG